MSFATLMVHLGLEQPNDLRLRIAGDLAEQCGARLIGIAASDPQPPYYADGTLAVNVIEQEREAVQEQMKQAEAQFRRTMQARTQEIEWRSAFARPADYVARQARAADLVITGTSGEGVLVDPLRYLDPSDLVMQLGRPMLVIPAQPESTDLTNVVVGWRDTGESRRAIAGALPLLQRAMAIEVVEIVEDEAEREAAERRLADVVGWLGRHQARAQPRVAATAGKVPEQLDRIATENGAGLIVAGAYGHTRLREWIFGGVTNHLLTRSTHCSLLSH